MIKIPKEAGLTIGDHIKPILINKIRKNRHLINKQVTLSGWGSRIEGEPISLRTPLMKAHQTLVPTSWYPDSAERDEWTRWTKVDPDRNLQGSQHTGNGACLGDSGGN